MFRKLLATSALALIAATPLLAGNLEAPAVEAPVVFQTQSDWTGGYAGVNGTVAYTGGTAYFGAGVQGGYLYDMGDYVVGGEGSFDYVFSPSTGYIAGADAILGYDGGDVMPFVTVGASYVSPGRFGVSGGAGLAVKATDNLLLTARYRYSYFPTPGAGMHQGIVGLSYRF